MAQQSSDSWQKEAARLLDVDPDALETARSRIVTADTERRRIEQQLSKLGALPTLLARAQRDVDARSSPDVEALRDRVERLETDALEIRDSAASIAQSLQVLIHKKFDPREYPPPGSTALPDALDAVADILDTLGVETSMIRIATSEAP